MVAGGMVQEAARRVRDLGLREQDVIVQATHTHAGPTGYSNFLFKDRAFPTPSAPTRPGIRARPAPVRIHGATAGAGHSPGRCSPAPRRGRVGPHRATRGHPQPLDRGASGRPRHRALVRRGPGGRGSGGRRPRDRRQRGSPPRGRGGTRRTLPDRSLGGVRESRDGGQGHLPLLQRRPRGRGPACGGGRAAPRPQRPGARVRQRRRRRRVRGPRPLRPGGRGGRGPPRGEGHALGLAHARAATSTGGRRSTCAGRACASAGRPRRSGGSPASPCSGARTSPAPRRAADLSSTPRTRCSRASGWPLRWSRRDSRSPRSPTPTAPSSPSAVPLSAARIGNRVMLTVPGEMTVELGRRVRASARAALSGSELRHVVVAGYANEYVSYLTTPEEYAAQHYEGGTTVYGPASGPFLTAALADLAGRLGSGAPPPPAYPFDPTRGLRPDGPGYPAGAPAGRITRQPRAAARLHRAELRWRGGADGLDRPLDRAFVDGPAPRTRRVDERGRRPWPADPLARRRRPSAGARDPGAPARAPRHLPGLVGGAARSPGRAATASWSAPRATASSRGPSGCCPRARCGSRPVAAPGHAFARAALPGGGARARPHRPAAPGEGRGHPRARARPPAHPAHPRERARPHPGAAA